MIGRIALPPAHVYDSSASVGSPPIARSAISTAWVAWSFSVVILTKPSLSEGAHGAEPATALPVEASRTSATRWPSTLAGLVMNMSTSDAYAATVSSLPSIHGTTRPETSRSQNVSSLEMPASCRSTEVVRPIRFAKTARFWVPTSLNLPSPFQARQTRRTTEIVAKLSETTRSRIRLRGSSPIPRNGSRPTGRAGSGPTYSPSIR